MNPIDALEKSWSDGASLVTDIQPPQLTTSTPCVGWDVRALLNHTLGEAQMMTRVNLGEVPDQDHGDLVGDGRQLSKLWEDTARDNVASWRKSGLAGDRTYFYGTFSADASVLINLGEVLVHCWDLAQAVVREFEIDPELATLVHGLYSATPLDGMRAGGMLGPEIAVPADASVADRMLGLLGRKP